MCARICCVRASAKLGVCIYCLAWWRRLYSKFCCKSSCSTFCIRSIPDLAHLCACSNIRSLFVSLVSNSVVVAFSPSSFMRRLFVRERSKRFILSYFGFASALRNTASFSYSRACCA